MASLGALYRLDKTISVTCPRCNGPVMVPQEVSWEERPWRNGYEPKAHCGRCAVDWDWHDEKMPVSGNTSVYKGDVGKTNVWYADRVLEAPAPTIVEE